MLQLLYITTNAYLQNMNNCKSYKNKYRSKSYETCKLLKHTHDTLFTLIIYPTRCSNFSQVLYSAYSFIFKLTNSRPSGANISSNYFFLSLWLCVRNGSTHTHTHTHTHTSSFNWVLPWRVSLGINCTSQVKPNTLSIINGDDSSGLARELMRSSSEKYHSHPSHKSLLSSLLFFSAKLYL